MSRLIQGQADMETALKRRLFWLGYFFRLGIWLAGQKQEGWGNDMPGWSSGLGIDAF